MDDDLWMIQAVIQPFKLDAVSFALQEVPGFGGMTVSDCRGYGHGKLAPDQDPDAGLEGPRTKDAGLIDYTGKIRVDVAVSGRATADRVVEAIAQAARTGRRGDGKVFLWPLTRAVRVRTLDEGPGAI